MARIELYAPVAPLRTWAILTVPLATGLFLAADWIADRLFGFVGLTASAASGRWQDNLAGLFGSGLVLAGLWLWLRYFEHRSLRSAGLSDPHWGQFGRGMLAGLILVVCVVAAGLGLGVFEINGPGAWYDHLTPTWLFVAPMVIIGTILQAITLETLFRGWMMQTIAAKWGGALAVAVNIVTFAVLRTPGISGSPEALLGAFNIVLIGWLLSLGAIRDGTVWGVCGLHAGWVLVTGLGLGLNIDGTHLNVTPMLLNMGRIDDAPWWLSGGGFGPDGSILMTVVAGIALLWRLRGGKSARITRVSDGFDPHDEVFDH